VVQDFTLRTVKGATLTAVHEKLMKNVEATFGYNEDQSKIIHIKCKDEANTGNVESESIDFFYHLFLDFAEHLAYNNILRSQTFDSTKSVSSFQQLHDNMLKDKQNTVIDRNTVYESEQGVFVAFLGKTAKREDIRDLLIDHCSDFGLTVKLEGKATVKGASSALGVTMRIGFNDKNERMIHCQNEVSFLGGDKSGTTFKEFAKQLACKLEKRLMLRETQPKIEQQTQEKQKEES